MFVAVGGCALKRIIVVCLMFALVGGACFAQQAASGDIRQLVPSNALLVAGFDWRADNASIRVINGLKSAETKDILAQQQTAMRTAVEKLATLFGISLDFVREIDSWSGQQWAIVVLPEGAKRLEPALIVASTSEDTANATLDKMFAPWQRIGEVAPQQVSGYPVTSFKSKDGKVQVYATASGNVVVVSQSLTGLAQALQGTGFPAGSAGDKAFRALSGSMFYLYADPVLVKRLDMARMDVPMSGFAVGISAVETGIKLRALGYPTEQASVFLNPILSTQKSGVLTANAGVPSNALAAAALPDLSGLAGIAGMLGMSGNPVLDIVQALGGTQISAAVTAVLPAPAGVATAMAGSPEAASEKLTAIMERAKQLKLKVEPATVPPGIEAAAIAIPHNRTLYLAQVEDHVLLATDPLALNGAASAVIDIQPGLAQSQLYKETIAGLDNSNLLTLFVNLAPVQGVGYLADGVGIGMIAPFYGAIASELEKMQALGLGVGYDGEAVSATLFLRADPKMGPWIGPSAASFTAIGAAVLFPVFSRARDAARAANCASNLKELALAAQMYAGDYDGKLPTRDQWRSQLKPYMRNKDILECPTGGAVYAFNKNLGGLNLYKIKNPADVVMFFEADSDLPNAAGSRADAILPHGGKGWFAYSDGHVTSDWEVPEQAHWVPKYASPKPVKKVPAKRR